MNQTISDVSESEGTDMALRGVRPLRGTRGTRQPPRRFRSRRPAHTLRIIPRKKRRDCAGGPARQVVPASGPRLARQRRVDGDDGDDEMFGGDGDEELFGDSGDDV